MLTNDIKKGWRIRLRNGWYATMADNAKGNARMADVEGFEREIGSVYAWDIMQATDPLTGDIHAIDLTDKQLKAQAMNKKLWG